jgi:hypothetical protein
VGYDSDVTFQHIRDNYIKINKGVLGYVTRIPNYFVAKGSLSENNLQKNSHLLQVLTRTGPG